MAEQRDAAILRQNRFQDGRELSIKDREQVVKRYLPEPRPAASSATLNSASKYAKTSNGQSKATRSRHAFRPPSFVLTLLHKLIFFAIQLVFSFYIRVRQTYHAVIAQIFSVLYYHHRSPELIQRDIKGLSRLPKHLSVIVELQGSSSAEGLGKLVDDVAEIAAWCACAGIPLLSVYEQTGIMKSHIPALHYALNKTLRSYFAPTHLPSLHIRAPHLAAYSPEPSSSPHPDASGERRTSAPPSSLKIILLSASDGRATLVDLTKTLAEMSQRGKLSPADISADLIDAELSEISCPDPDLLVVMAPSAYRARPRRKKAHHKRALSRGAGEQGSAPRGRPLLREGAQAPTTSGADADAAGGLGVGVGEGLGVAMGVGVAPALATPSAAALHVRSEWIPAPGGEVCLRGYPPWQVRLTEIFQVQDNAGVGYQVFLRALYRYAKAQMRFGR